MTRLTPAQSEILRLRTILDHSYEEIATTLGINVGTVKSRIARARQSLHALMAEVCPEFGRDASAAEWFGRPSAT
jgi:RNA polymerase sigma-70 factor, ECF subfamily